MSSSLIAALLTAMLSLPSSGSNYILGTFDVPAVDSAAVREHYGIEAFANPASSRGLSVGEDGALTLTTTLAADSAKDYSVKAGVKIPLNNLWAPVDIRQATAITFRIKGSGAYNVNVSLGSDAYAQEGGVETAPIKVTTAFSLKSIPLQPTPAISWPIPWMEGEPDPVSHEASIIMDPSDSLYNDPKRNVAMSVRYLQFAIDPTWKSATAWTAPVAGPTTLVIDDIVLEFGDGGSASVGNRPPQARSFSARYHQGLLSLRGLEGYTALEVRTHDGTRVATLAPSPTVRIRLDRGAYLLVARSEGKPALSRTLVVAR